MWLLNLAGRVETCYMQRIAFVTISVWVCANANDHFQEVSLTCEFYENIGDRRQNFTIIAENSETALKCFWKNKTPYCLVTDGYRYDWRLSDTVTVRRSPHLGPHPETCSCFLFDHDKTSYERPCSVQVTRPDGSSLTPADQSWEFPDNSPPQNSEMKDPSTHTQDSQPDDAWRIVPVILSALAMGLLASFSIYYVCRRRPRQDDALASEKLTGNV